MSTREIVIPYSPRNWARLLHASFKRWAVLVLHRRAGKTTAILNHHQRAALDNQWESKRLRSLMPNLSERDLANLLKRRTYWHIMPTFHQAKLTGAWDTLQEISRPVPGAKPNQSEMSVVYPNGNRVQLVGADNPDALRGPALSGCSLDEYSQMLRNLFGEIISKALADHLGYCIWSGTIKGTDHLYDTYQVGKSDPDWFSLWQNIDVSLQTEEGATINALRQALEDDRKLVLDGLMSQAEFDQEWYLSPEAAIKGAFYAEQIKALRERGQICRVPYDPSLPVQTDWDLGIDAMAVWFSQWTRSGEVHLIDYYEDVGGGMEAAIKAIKGQMANPGNDAAVSAVNLRRSRYTYSEHWGPHDIETTEISSGKTRKKIAYDLGLTFKVNSGTGTPGAVADGITAAQFMLAKCWFDDNPEVNHGIDCLRQYKRTWQQRLNQFSATPVHDWASHGADAFRGLAMRYRQPVEKKERERRERNSSVSQWG